MSYKALVQGGRMLNDDRYGAIAILQLKVQRIQ